MTPTNKTTRVPRTREEMSATVCRKFTVNISRALKRSGVSESEEATKWFVALTKSVVVATESALAATESAVASNAGWSVHDAVARAARAVGVREVLKCL